MERFFVSFFSLELALVQNYCSYKASAYRLVNMLPVSALSSGPSRELRRIDVVKILFLIALFISFLATYLVPPGTGFKLLFGEPRK